MEKKILRNLNLNFWITLITSILLFVVNKYFANYMGIENLGLMKLFTQLVGFLGIAESGLNVACTYALYKPIINKDIRKIEVIVSTLSVFYRKISIVIIIVGGLLSFCLPIIIKGLFENVFYIYWNLYVINITINYWSAKYSILFIANQEYSYVRKIEGIAKFLFQILQILVIVYFSSFIGFILLMICQNIFIYFFYKKHFKKNYSYIGKSKEMDRSIFKDMRNLFWHKFAGIIVYNTDYIIISSFLSLSIVGIYSSYMLICQVILTLVTIITSVLNPIIGIYIAKNNNEKNYLYWKKLDSLYFVLGSILVVCTYRLSNHFIKLWLGEEYILSQLTVFFVIINLFIQIIREMMGVFKNNYGFFDDLYVPIAESLINLILSLILVYIMGLNGVILGTLISNMIIIVIIKPILIFKRCFNKNKKEYFEYIIKKISLFTISFIINLKFLKLIVDLEQIDTWQTFVKFSFINVFFVTILTILIFLLDYDFRNLVCKFIVNIKKNSKE